MSSINSTIFQKGHIFFLDFLLRWLENSKKKIFQIVVKKNVIYHRIESVKFTYQNVSV